MNPRVTYLSPGPGNPDWIPVIAARRLREAKVVFHPPSTGRTVIERHVSNDTPLRETPSTGDELAPSLLEAARNRGEVVRVTRPGGTFDRPVTREIEALSSGDVELEVLPALDRGRGGALLAGVPLDAPGTVRTVRTGGPDAEHSPGVAPPPATDETLLIDYENPEDLRRFARHGIEAGHPAESTVILVENPTRNDQRTRRVTLVELAEGTGDEIPARGVALTGRAVRERHPPRWLQDRPLHGTRIIVTRPRSGPDRLTRRLRRAGARVHHYPSIRIRLLEDGLEELRDPLRDLSVYGWVVFTSRNGVRFFFQALETSGNDVRCLHRSRIACIGKGTARALEERGLQADLIPDTYRAESLAASLIEHTRSGDRILLARARGAREVLPRRLEEKNRPVREIPLYVAEPAREHRGDLQRALEVGEADMITFTSSSTVDNLFDLLGDPDGTRRRLNRLACAAIGPITADSLRQRGVEVQVIPDQYDFQHLTEAIANYYRNPGRRGQNVEVPSR